MRKIMIAYEHKTANGTWIKRDYITDNSKDYERVVNTIHQNKDEYKVIEVKHT